MNALAALPLLIAGALAVASTDSARPAPKGQWTPAQANAWYAKQPWLVGCNFAPSTAINQLEMWQADTFDPATIDRELGWAEGLGFNSVRVFLHNLLWTQDEKGFCERIDRFLAIAARHHISVMMVPLDGVWDPYPRLGKQREPRPHVHNSGWVQAPGVEILKDSSRHDELKPYIQGLLRRYKNDRRIVAWDLFNEPDNINRPAYNRLEPANKAELALALLTKVFAWAREVRPSQPLTAAPWLGDWQDPAKLSPIERFMLEESDVITYHNYGDLSFVRPRVEALRRYGRPILCSEYMARPNGSTFDLLPYFKEQKVGAYSWGFVSGKSQTIYPWDSWTREYTAEPPVWFHDVLRPDGKPFRQAEVDLIRKTTGKRP
jgi:hypothetical protein